MEGLILMAVLTAAIVAVMRFQAARRAARLVRVLEDPNLGTLRYDADLDGWRCKVGDIKFHISGDLEPDIGLRAHAADIVHSPDAFLRRVRDFLEREAAQEPRWAKEVRSLTLDEVCLFWPKRPNDGMLYFAAPEDDGRIWRCDYIKREPIGLGFDS